MIRRIFKFNICVLICVFSLICSASSNYLYSAEQKKSKAVADKQNDSSGSKSKKASNSQQNNDSPTIITSDGPLDVNFDKNIAIFRDNVVVKDNRGELYADLMRVFFKKDNKDISLIEAEKNVVIHMDNKIAKSDKAVYKVDAGLLELTGNPRIQEDKNIYAADKITIFQKDGKSQMKLEPKAKLLLYRDLNGKNGTLF